MIPYSDLLIILDHGRTKVIQVRRESEGMSMLLAMQFSRGTRHGEETYAMMGDEDSSKGMGDTNK